MFQGDCLRRHGVLFLPYRRGRYPGTSVKPHLDTERKIKWLRELRETTLYF